MPKYLLASIVILLPVIAFAQHEGITAEVASKRYSSGYLAVVGSYVEYELKITNTIDDLLPPDQSLTVTIVWDDDVIRSASYSIPTLEPRSDGIVHLGPFKLEHEGKHTLHVRMNNVTQGYAVDTFTVYKQSTIEIAFVIVALIVSGGGIILFLSYRKRMVNRFR